MSLCPFMYKEYHDKNYQKYRYKPTANYLCTFLEVKELTADFPWYLPGLMSQILKK